MSLFTRKPGKLRELIIDRVDLVDAGANPDAHIMLYKREDEFEKRADPERDATGEVVPVVHVDKHFEDPASLDGFMSFIRGAWREANPAAGEGDYPYVEAIYPNFVIACIGSDTFRVPYMSDGDTVTFGDRTKVEAKVTYVAVDKNKPPEASSSARAKENPVADNENTDAEALAKIEAHVAAEVAKAVDAFKSDLDTLADAGPAENEDPVEKALAEMPEPVRKRFEEQEAEIAKARAEMEKLTKAERAARFAKTAAAVELTTVPADVLDDIEKAAPAAYAKLEAALAVCQERIAKGDLFAEHGTGGDPAGTDSAAKLDTLAKAYQAEHGGNYVDAYAHVYATNRDLAKAATHFAD